MSKREYFVIQIGNTQLDNPINMTMSTKRKNKTFCEECGNAIEVGETYYYEPLGQYYYCVGCIGVDGDPYNYVATPDLY
ncbi:MAG: hypothetical protein ABIK92_11330 [Pseudomonadota bacterium]